MGTTITPYMQFYVASAVVDKGVTPATYRNERVDTVSGAIWSDVVSMFIIIATAAAIGGSGALSSAEEAAKALVPQSVPTHHNSLQSAYSAPRSLPPRWCPSRRPTPSPMPSARPDQSRRGCGTRRCSTGSSRSRSFSGLRSLSSQANLVSLTVNVQVLNGVITPMLLTYVPILANRRGVLGAAANGRLFKTVATICVAAVGTLSFVVLVETVFGLG